MTDFVLSTTGTGIGTGLTLGQMRDELRNINGVDLEAGEADRLLNEGYRELAVRSGWWRKSVDLGPTVAGEHAYPLEPGTIHRILRIYVDGRPYVASSEVVVVGIRLAELRQRAHGHWYLDYDAQGDQVVVLEPTPGTSGLDIHSVCVVYPDPMVADIDTTVLPWEFQRGPINFASAIALGGPEDNLEARSYYMDEFERMVIRLRQHRISRTGSGVAQLRIAGWT